MERKVNKQLWLECSLKELYKKLPSHRAAEKSSSHQKKKLNVPTPLLISATGHLKRKEDENSQELPPSRKQKRLPKKNTEEPSKEEHSEQTAEKFWNFVDEYSVSKPFHARSKNGFLNSLKLPSAAVNCTLWGIGNTITLRSRVILTSEKFTLPGSNEEGEINSADHKEVLAQKILYKIQKSRIRKATDSIAQEVLEERNANKT